ncbi:MAG: hypothetical protein GX483_08130 [Actinomycetaceae bacterium]|nr:hypothetical protein [Actinomycetaceae bacterium]
MTIQLAASARALTTPTPVDVNDTSIVPDTLTTAWIGVDLSAFGADSGLAMNLAQELPIERVNVRRLEAGVQAAHKGGLDFVSLGCSFHTRSDYRIRDCTLDATNMVAELAEHSTGGIFAEVPAKARHINQAIDLLAPQSEGWAGITIAVDENTSYKELAESLKAARQAGVRIAVLLSDAQISHELAENIAQVADVVRLRITDPHSARETRFMIRAAAQAHGRELPVLAELGIVISASLQAAEERSVLISEMMGVQLFEGMASTIGTVYDVADTIESWVGLGAADGVVLIPASLPTDLASILRGVIPLLQERTALDQK